MLKQRVLTAIVLVSVLLPALFWLPQWAWLGVVAAIAGIGAWEWAGLVAAERSTRRLYAGLVGLMVCGLGLLGGVGGVAGYAAVLAVAYVCSLGLWLGLVPRWLRHGWNHQGRSALMIGLVVLVPTALAMAHLRLLDIRLLLAALVLVWVADIAAYFTGRAFGRRKLAPSVSPGKTWEGAFGAAAGVTITGLLAFVLLPANPAGGLMWLLLPILLIAYTALSIIGDLFESLVKRRAGAKDSGTLLPGHGGVLDRIDSLTSALPVAGLLVMWLF